MTAIGHELVNSTEIRGSAPKRRVRTRGLNSPGQIGESVAETRGVSVSSITHPSSRIEDLLRRHPDLFDNPKAMQSIPDSDVDLLGDIAERYGVFDVTRSSRVG